MVNSVFVLSHAMFTRLSNTSIFNISSDGIRYCQIGWNHTEMGWKEYQVRQQSTAELKHIMTVTRPVRQNLQSVYCRQVR